MSSTTGPKRYGLIAKKPARPVAARAPVVNVFAAEDSDEEEDIARVNRDMVRARQLAADKALAAAEAVSTDVFDYDGYLATKEPVAAPVKSRAPLKSKYVQDIMSVSQVREREQDRVYERRLLKERKEEDALFPETEKFVTGAYRQKLSEDAKWEYEDRLAERVEASTDVRGRGMAGFYANLLTKNIAMGGALESAVSAYTAGSERHARLGLDERSEPAESPHSAREPVDETQGEVPLVTKPEAHTQPIERIAEEPSAALVASSAKDSVDKRELVLSAKERYEMRKKMKTAISNV